MNDTADLLAGVGVQDRPKAVAVIGDMVWWVTIVDATLVRHHQEAYDRLLEGLPVRRRRRVEGILGGLRFVRNRMREEAGCGHFIGPSPDGERWWWMPVPPPSGDSLAARALEWEMTRYSSYSTHVAGRTTGHVFENALAFLRQAIAESTDESPGLITGAATHGHAKVAHGRSRDSNSRILRAGRGTGPAECRCGRTGVPADDPADP